MQLDYNDVESKDWKNWKIEQKLGEHNNDSHNGDVETLDWFKIRLWFRSNQFMEIKQIRAYNFQTLVGNGGGYIGLFLGCTIIELPSMISSAYAWMQRNVCPYHWVK